MGWEEMGWDGMGWAAMGWDGMGWAAMGCDGTGWERHGLMGLVPRRRPRLAQPRDGDLGQVDDGPRVGAAQVANVGEREGAALEVGHAELARGGVRLQPLQVSGDLEQRLGAHVLHVGHEQPCEG
jgi:hypothetical protein